MIYTAILIACLSLDPEPRDCKRHEMLIQGSAIPYGAAVEAQSLAARWLEEHPGMQQKSLTVLPGRGA